MEELISKAAAHWACELDGYSHESTIELYGHVYPQRVTTPELTQALIDDLRSRRIRVEQPGSGYEARGWQQKVQGGLDALRSAILGQASPQWVAAWRSK
jgi:hypothetical protein